MQPQFTYNAVVTDIHDGDTITVIADLGFRVSFKTPIRFNGINAPELKTPEGIVSRDYLKSILPTKVIVKTYKNPTDKYGRWLADIFDGDTNINEQMISSGHAVFYDGGAK